MEAFARALREGVSDDPESRRFALFALGASPGREAQELAAGYLDSADPKERWVAAIALGAGTAADPRIPGVLIQMLTEYLPDDVQAMPLGDNFFEMYRGWAPRLLAKSADRSAAPALRSALEAVGRLLGQNNSALDADAVDLPRPVSHVNTDYWEHYQDDIVYALGRLGAFGALTGLPMSPPRLDLWAIQLTFGALHGRYEARDVPWWRADGVLPQEVLDALAARFGWDAEQQHAASERYLRVKLAHLYLLLNVTEL